jgi:hypothetical protein
MSSKTTKNLFQVYYSGLDRKAKRELIDKIKSETHVAEITIMFWIMGKRNPRELYKQKIAEVVGMDKEKLFS